MIVVGSHAAALRGDYDLGRDLTTSDIDIFGTREEVDSLMITLVSREPTVKTDMGHKVLIRRTALVRIPNDEIQVNGERPPIRHKFASPTITFKVMPNEYLEALTALPDNMEVEIFEGVPGLAISAVTNALGKRCLRGISEKEQHFDDAAYLKEMEYFGMAFTPAHADYMRLCRARLLWEVSTGNR